MQHYVKPIAAVYETDLEAYEPANGDCFDWLDHDTRELVLEAININDKDDVGDFYEALQRPYVNVSKRGRRAAAVGASTYNRAKRINEWLEV